MEFDVRASRLVLKMSNSIKVNARTASELNRSQKRGVGLSTSDIIFWVGLSESDIIGYG